MNGFVLFILMILAFGVLKAMEEITKEKALKNHKGNLNNAQKKANTIPSNPSLKITVDAPIVIERALWCEATKGGFSPLKCSPENLWKKCTFYFKPSIPISRTVDNARTIVYVMWSGNLCHVYNTELEGRQYSSKYTGWSVSTTVAFFNNDTKNIIKTFKFEGKDPGEKGLMFSGSSDYYTGQKLGELPKIIFSTKSLGNERYIVSPVDQSTNFFIPYGWRINTCEACKNITPHLESRRSSQKCLLCGTFRKR